MHITTPQVKFDFENLIKFISYLRDGMHIERVITSIQDALDNSKWSTEDQHFIITQALRNADDKYIEMYYPNPKENLPEIMTMLAKDSDAYKIQFINDAKNLIVEKGINYLNLEDAHSCVHRLIPEDLSLLKEVLEGDTNITGLSIYSWFPEVTGKAIEIIKSHLEIKDFHLIFLHNQEDIKDLSENTFVVAIRNQVQDCHYLEDFTLEYSTGDYSANPIVCLGAHMPLELGDL